MFFSSDNFTKKRALEFKLRYDALIDRSRVYVFQFKNGHMDFPKRDLK